MPLSRIIVRPVTLLDALILGILAVSTAGAREPRSLDHIVALACGGPDSVANLQWQTVDDARAKDAWERKACARP